MMDAMTDSASHPTYERVYTVVGAIPKGTVATYGQIASIVGNCTARMVGYALASLPAEYEIPWHRVINAQGKVSPRAHSDSTALQRERLEDEGIQFNASGKVNLRQVRWDGPEMDWLLSNGFDPAPSWRDA
jgi:methylated-DNA-protein-cysteine methyltransferase-like protein